MNDHLDQLPNFVNKIKSIKDVILTNIVLCGQIPAPTFKEGERAAFLLERLSELNVDECSYDEYQNPVGIIRGTKKAAPPIFVVAHLDTFFKKDISYNYTIKHNEVVGPGLLDNSLGVGILASIPEILRRLKITFESDIVLASVIQSLGKGNLFGIRNLLETWPTPIRGAVCIEGFELGRLNYFSDGMIRCEIYCQANPVESIEGKERPNAIIILNEVINQILHLNLPQNPRTKIVIGKIAGGLNHGEPADEARLGFEMRSDSAEILKLLYNNVRDIIDGINHEFKVDTTLKTISNLDATHLKFNHPLVKSTVDIMKKLGIIPVSKPSETELSIFLSRQIPAVTLGVTHGKNHYQENATMEIEPMYKGIAQIIGVLMAIDNGVCDE